MEIEISTPVIGAELGGSIVQDDYERLKNLPKINGVELIGNKTTEELGIEAGSNIELITELKPESIEEDLAENQVYNGNAIHDLARIFGMTLEEIVSVIPSVVTEFDIENEYDDNQVYNANAIHQLLEIFVTELENIQEYTQNLFLDVDVTISLATMTISNVSCYSEDIIKAHEQGKVVRAFCKFEENYNMDVVVMLNVVDGKWAFFYPTIMGDIGAGMKNYIFRLGIGKDSATISANSLLDEDSKEEIIDLIDEKITGALGGSY